MIKTAIIFSALLYGGIIDYKRREIPDIVPIVIVLCALSLDFKILSGILCLMAAAAVFWVAAKLTKTEIPGGDFKLICALSFACGLLETASLLAITGLLAVLVGIILRRKMLRKIPLCSYLAVSYNLLNLALWGVAAIE